MNLKETCKERVIITAHRGVFGGNIPCNTMPAFEIALKHGADMLEIDVDRTADGQLIIFHPGQERSHLCFGGRVRHYTLAQLQEVIRYCNYDGTQTEWGFSTLDEIFETFKGRCYINVDKFWDNPEEISKAIYRHGVKDQIVVKSTPRKQVFDVLEEVAPDLLFFPIYNNTCREYHEELNRRNINYAGAELVFDTENCEVGTAAFRRKLKAEGKLLWGNAILYNYRVPLAAGHSDDAALVRDPDFGWGWFVDEGFDIIQTDWPLALDLYLKEAGKRYRS